MKFATVKFDVDSEELGDVTETLTSELGLLHSIEFDDFQDAYVISINVESVDQVRQIWISIVADLFPRLDYDGYVEAFVEGL